MSERKRKILYLITKSTWVSQSWGLAQDLLRNLQSIANEDFQKVYSLRRMEKVSETFARGCQVFFELVKKNNDNLNSAGTAALSRSIL